MIAIKWEGRRFGREFSLFIAYLIQWDCVRLRFVHELMQVPSGSLGGSEMQAYLLPQSPVLDWVSLPAFCA